MTWYEYVKQMNIEEFAEFLENFRQCPSCHKWGNGCFTSFDVLRFLNSECTEEKNNHG